MFIIICVIIAVVAIAIYLIRRGNLDFFKIASINPDEFYSFIVDNDAWRLSKSSEKNIKLEGPFLLYVPKLGKRIKYYGVIGLYEKSQEEYIAYFNQLNMVSGDLSLREKIKRDFGEDLDISGGGGQTIGDPIVINESCKDYVGMEYYVIKLIYSAMGVNYKVAKQTLLDNDDKKIDQIKLAVESDDDNFYNFYFDVTEHVNK